MNYSIELCRELMRRAAPEGLTIGYRPNRYDAGDILEVDIHTVWPELDGRARFRIEIYAGGGFAGQVYRCVLEALDMKGQREGVPLVEGRVYAVKIMLPPSAFSRRFRDALYGIAFQASFSAQVSMAACRAGLLWQKIARLAAAAEWGDADAVADVYASFYDPRIGAWGEIREWVEGRTWRLEADTRLRERSRWRDMDPADCGSPEYVAKRQFMFRFVKMLHAMGAVELARQYEWWTLKSQPNVLKRSGHGGHPGKGLCAVDFRAGLALVPFLPMSPADVGLILRGIGRGALVQFDRCDFSKLREYVADRGAAIDISPSMIERLEAYDQTYRRSMPDLTHQGARLFLDGSLRRNVREGLVEGYRVKGIIDADFASRLDACAGRFAAFYLLGAVPVLGRLARRLWGHAAFRRHVARLFGSLAYFKRAGRATVAANLVDWHRTGRTGEARTRFLADRPAWFWLQRLTLGLLPWPGLHRVLAEPAYVRERLSAAWRFVTTFYGDAAFRERWLGDQVRRGYQDGLLDEGERDAILASVGDPFIVKYLKSLAVHFATMPVTQVVSVTVGGMAAGWILASGGSLTHAGAVFGWILLFFQFTPVSPGSLCRGGYVVYLISKEKNFRDYMVAAPIAFVKYLGYLAFPFQMATTYPALSRFMAGQWATGAVHIVPIFGEKGALLEHMVFDLCFNVPRVFGLWARARMKGLLDAWLLLGVILLTIGLAGCRMACTSRGGINLIMAVVAVFVLPRVLFYPLLTRRKARTARSGVAAGTLRR